MDSHAARPVPPGPAGSADQRRLRLRKLLRSEGRYFLEVTALCGFAIAQPLLDLFGKSAQEFLTASATRSDIVLFALAVAFFPPAVLSAVAALGRLGGERLRLHLHHALVAALSGLFTLQVLEGAFEWPRWSTIALSASAAVAAALVVARFAGARLFLAYAGFAPLLLVALFLFTSPVSTLVLETRTAATAAHAESDVPILFLILDELPTASLLDDQGGIDAQLFPNFAALAGDATWYRNHTTVATITQTAVPAIVTGQIPFDAATVPVSSEYEQSIFTLLGRSYTMNVSERVTSICPTNICGEYAAGSGGGLREMLRHARDVWVERLDPHPGHQAGFFNVGSDPVDIRRIERLEEFLPTVGATRGARLDFAHVLLPHQPWQLLSTGHVYEQPLDGLVFFNWVDPEAGEVPRQRHFEQLRLTDAYLGRLLDRLKERGVYDDTLIVVTADHGGSFTADQPVRAIAEGNEVDIAFTPLLVKAPGQAEGEVDDRNAMTIDILPTVADLVGVDIPWPVDGISLLGEPRATTDKQLFPYRLDLLKPGDDGLVTLDGERLFADLLARGPSRPPGDDTDLRVYRHGEYAELIGREVSELEVGPPSEVSADLDNPAPTVDPTSDERPVVVRGELDAEDTRPYAIALNGVIATWTRGHDKVSDPDFWALLPESLLHDGENALTVYEISGDPATPTLRPVATR